MNRQKMRVTRSAPEQHNSEYQQELQGCEVEIALVHEETQKDRDVSSATARSDREKGA